VLDAELAIDDARGHQLFDVLGRRARMSIPQRITDAARRYPARLYVFDLLALDGRDVRDLPLLERKRLLRELFVDAGGLIFVNGICGHGRAAFEQVVALDLEGLVAKRLSSSYRSGRTRDWLKVLNPSYHRRAMVLRGWRTGAGRQDG
jgi:bifunctional non-homologous end joining protein LigD